MAYKERLLLESFGPKPPDLLFGEELNRGAYGIVHSGVFGDRPVAVKKIHKLLFDEAKSRDEIEKVITDFKNEADKLTAIRHPHVVQSFGAFYDPNMREPILVMELMAMDLRTFIEKIKGNLRLKVAQQLLICFQITLGLQYLHHLSPPLAHRDLNDKNVLLAEDDTAKIGDLGQSKYKDKKKKYFDSTAPGSIPFMPPETFGVNPHYTESVDIFSLGVLAVEVATQSFPSVGMIGIGTMPEVERRANDLKKMGDDHPLKPLVLKCLKDNYKERPDIDHVVFSLQKIFENDSSDLENLKVQMKTIQEREQAEKREWEKQLLDRERELEHLRNALSRTEIRVEYLVKEAEAKDVELQYAKAVKEQCVKEMQVLRREAATKKKHESQQLEEFEFYKKQCQEFNARLEDIQATFYLENARATQAQKERLNAMLREANERAIQAMLTEANERTASILDDVLTPLETQRNGCLQNEVKNPQIEGTTLKTAGREDVAEEQSIVLTGNVHQPDTKLIDQEAKHQSRRENKGALSFERKEKREAKSGTLPRGLKLGQPEQGGLLATAKDFGGASDELRQKLEKRKKATEEHIIVTVQNPSTQAQQVPSAHYPIARLRTDSIGHKRPSKEERRLRSMTITGDAKSFFRDLGRESGESDELRAKLSKWKKQADTNVFTSSAKDPGSTS